MPDATAAGGCEPSGAAEREVRAIHDRWAEQTAAKDLDGLMAHVAEDVVSYEHAGPLGYRGIEEVREICRNGLAASPGPVAWDIPDLTVRVGGDLAVAWGLDHIRSTGADGTTAETWSRGTRVFERRDGGWAMVHQHLSFPLPS
ncbi:nuclear transport factor 2 family protein [Kitasatospora sp. A2-31]|nr:nuclear transport factor 2 family protein [Kitasatospora sp. A2-31]MCG6498111.1 nuclear transport factor 2 family protein [Kitasatospora sp. A2-31]